MTKIKVKVTHKTLMMSLEFPLEVGQVKMDAEYQVFVYKDKNSEKWFIGANDKIYLNQNLYNQDPNKNVYVDPVKMGLSAL